MKEYAVVNDFLRSDVLTRPLNGASSRVGLKQTGGSPKVGGATES